MKDRDAESVIEWRPRRDAVSICAFTVAVGDSAQLLSGVVHNANWAVAHGSSFTLFRSKMVEDAQLESRWEKVAATRLMLQRDSCLLYTSPSPRDS